MIARCKLLAGLAAIGMAGAKPTQGSPNPHDTGREATPIEREFHLESTAGRPGAESCALRPANRIDEIWVAVKLVLPWMRGL